MYKNQLQELAQRSCFNLPSYSCIREGPDHAPRFKATVNFNGDTFESPNYCSTLRQAEHSAAEVALHALANGGPSQSLAAKVLDETGVYKNLLQEVSQRVAAPLPAYTTYRSGLKGHLPLFRCTVVLAGVTFTGEPAKNKKQAEKNAAMSAWSSLKLLEQQQSENSKLNSPDKGGIRIEEQEHVTVARAFQIYLIRSRVAGLPFPISYQSTSNPSRPSTSTQQQPLAATSSKILPLIRPRTHLGIKPLVQTRPPLNPPSPIIIQPVQSFSVGAPPYIPVRHLTPLHHRIAPPVTVRSAIPVFSAPPRRPPSQPPYMYVRQGVVPVYPSLPEIQPFVKEPHPSKAPLVGVKEKRDTKLNPEPPEKSAPTISTDL
ncbi:unnamed protein product [Cuscuta europaea]|uniref:DRBM domain-containing protein n=1 Tax=Cuscuta europaea TaxID=41803 RepID=A0A9P0YVM2_CUSEU|nr:unnamed protein product [Cuscuta europaea]